MPRLVVPLLVLLVAAAPLAAQVPQGGARANELYVHAYTLKHQKASEAIMLIHPLLSNRGTVELQVAGNTLVIRDTLAGLARIVPVLRSFDRPARPLRLELYVLRASRATVSPIAQPPGLPVELLRRLRALLPYDIYEIEAQAQVTGLEGRPVTYEVGGGFEVSFRLGMVMPNRNVRLNDFRVLRRDRQRSGQTVFHSHLNLTLDNTAAISMAKNETSPEALMVVLTARQDTAPRVP